MNSIHRTCGLGRFVTDADVRSSFANIRNGVIPEVERLADFTFGPPNEPARGSARGARAVLQREAVA